MIDLLFIYGTLLEDERNEYARYLRDRSESLGPATIQGRLFEISWYPGVVDSVDPNEVVKGELVRITSDVKETIAKLDDYEGYIDNNLDASEFVRAKVSVQLKTNMIESWVYLYNQPTSGLYQIVTGDFLKYIAKN